MLYRKLLFLLLLVSICNAIPVAACTCAVPNPSPCQPLSASGEDIFVGTVTKMEELPQSAGRDPFGKTRIPIVYRFHFRVEEVLSGNIQSEIDVFAGDPGLCGYHFEKDVTYVAFVHAGKDGRLWSFACTPTRPVEDAAALLPQLRAQRDGRKAASLYGVLSEWDLSDEQRREDNVDEGEDAPLPYVTMNLRNANGRAWQVETGAQGEYAFYDLPAGKYQVWAGPDPQRARSLELPAGACYENAIRLQFLPTGEVWGRVFGPGGKVMTDAEVSLIRVERYGDEAEGRMEVAEDNGYFHFRDVTPGKYYLVFNQENLTDSENPFPRTFFPGTTCREEAIKLEIREDGRYPNADIRLRLPKPPAAPSSKPQLPPTP